MKNALIFLLCILLSIYLSACGQAVNAYQVLSQTQPTAAAQSTTATQPTTSAQPTAVSQQAAANEEETITKLVKDFGSKLQTVSLLASEDIVKKSMQESYGEFVFPELLAKWQNEPLNAPGRLTSSPWPDRIEITSIEKATDNTYLVEGEIMEITSTEKPGTGSAVRRPITLSVKKSENRWLINDVVLGPYRDTDSVVYQNNQYGFDFTLPASWAGYSIIAEKWEGLAIGETQGENVIEMGPLLSIRHPLWTDKKPRQDIPVMVFTVDQWNQLQQDKFHIGAAPVGPTELGRNSKYVFALPARYNYTFPEGFEEVEKIIESKPLGIPVVVP